MTVPYTQAIVKTIDTLEIDCEGTPEALLLYVACDLSSRSRYCL
jgi:hypothetical protein